MHRCTALLLLMLASLGPAGAQTPAQPLTVTCSLEKSGDEFKGQCAIPCSVNNLAIDIDGLNPRRACDLPPRIVQASIKPLAGGNWLGRMEGKEPEDPTRFELKKSEAGKTGVAKLPYGWFALTKAELKPESLSLEIAANRTLPPTEDDIRIVQRAITLLATVDVWNKEDNRQCPPGQAKVSLFCALQNATTEISGGVHYRQPALQAVREVLNEVGGNRVKLHRIMDYNNHPETTLGEIHDLLRRAQAMVEKRFR
jgi:hypothetical protein